MSDARTFGPAAEEMKVALQRYSKEELVDLLTHIVKTYVIEGTLPLETNAGRQQSEAHLATLSFPELVLHLQMRLDHREWQQFSVSGDDVFVESGGQRLSLTSRRTALPQAPSGAPSPPPASAPGQAANPQFAPNMQRAFGNLPASTPPRTQPQGERPGPQQAAARPAPGPAPTPAQAAPPPESFPPPSDPPESPEPFEDGGVDPTERFGMLELD
jgi:hypothetical protein